METSCIEDRKALPRRALDDAGCERVVYVDDVVGESRDRLKTKCHQSARLVIIGFPELRLVRDHY